MGFINVEIKARCHQPDRVEKILLDQGADFKGEDHQVDTFFITQEGRLKLREGNIENALIFYRRSDQSGPKVSDVVLHKTEPQSTIKTILTEVLGIRVVVDKRRKIFFIGNVKFHIDAVKSLGSFVEIEAIDRSGNGDREALQTQCEHYMDLLEISSEDLISASYSDLIKMTKRV